MNTEVLFYLLISLVGTVWVTYDSICTKKIDWLAIVTILTGISAFCTSLYTLLHPY